MGKNKGNRTGGTSRRSGNPPVVSFSADFTPREPPSDVLDEDALLARAAAKGFVDTDSEQARYLLRRVGYTYVSDYFGAFKKGGAQGLRLVHQATLFDRRMQSVIMKYIGLFELQFRSQYSYLMALDGGAFAHRDPSNFKNRGHFDSFLAEYEGEVRRQLRNRNGRMARLVETYGDAPIWQAVQVMPLGMLSMLYNNTRSRSVRMGVADSFGVRYDTLASWMRTISNVRNKCAHFARIAGTKLVSPPKAMDGVNLRNTHPFYVVLMLEKLLNTDAEFVDDTSLMYSLHLAKDVADVIDTTPKEVTSRYVPPNWKLLISHPSIAGVHMELRPGAGSGGVIAVEQLPSGPLSNT